jgi:hypothetical protein
VQVRSANDWEDADLGDDARKQKFLKLMGAGKVRIANSDYDLGTARLHH